VSIGGILVILLQLLAWAIFIRAILSWIQPDPSNPIVRLLDQITEPILAPLRQIVPRIGMIDITPMVAFFVIQGLAVAVQRSGI